MKSKKAAPARKTPAPKPRRTRGRPRATQGAVGRDSIVAAAGELLQKVQPHKATISSIARQAGVDPALVRYYFKSREELLLAVVEDILATWDFKLPPPSAGPAATLAAHIPNMLDFARQYRSMQRLMIEECANSKSAEVRRRVRELNAGALHHYALMLHPDKVRRSNSTDALFIHVAIIGLCEFYAAAQSMIMPLVPEGTDPEELARRYKDFITRMVLDGLRSLVEPWSVKAPSAS